MAILGALSVRRFAVVALFAILLLVPLLAWVDEDPFLLTLVLRLMIFAIAALSLDLILGVGGLVSFGHAAFIGIGAYSFGILSSFGISSGLVQWPVGIALSALYAAAVGAISIRTSGVYFIMITLAFAQMIYFFFVSIPGFGGDDGLPISIRSNFAGVIDLGNRYHLYYTALVLLSFALLFSHRLVHSRFGNVIRGARSNPQRMAAIGFPVFRYQLAVFVIAGAMCGFAGMLIGNLTGFVSPNYMHWTRSGEIIFMVVLGGMGTLFGPVFGAGVYLMLETVLSKFTEYWQLVIGILLVLVALYAKQGLWGLFASLDRWLGRDD